MSLTSRQVKRVKLERAAATEEPEDDAMDYDPSDLDDDEKNEQAFNAARARRGRYMGVSIGGVKLLISVAELTVDRLSQKLEFSRVSIS